MPLITVRDASFAYDGKIAVSGLNFEVNSGDYLCVVGENGSGKSTLLRGLLRLKAPLEGRVLFGDGLRANEIGYLPQQSAIQRDFPAGVQEVVLSGRMGRSRGLLPFYTSADKASAEMNMRRLGILDLRNRCYRELSGGQQQRVLLARALCATGRLLLLDEPVAGLDPVVRQELYREIEKINHEDGITVIMVSHDVSGAAAYADYVLHLHNRQIFFGAAKDYAASAEGAEFLSEPKRQKRQESEVHNV
ncbi:MAG: metal ABC transporter ATP-binding protein [Oscillospiraceae bacterium]|jgi:zinc transport system ATP-binding protein|nr:metal ABC transporter ATP-binding protein [Oscillospiraceae bacterium]